jgi:hypothetical protein
LLLYSVDLGGKVVYNYSCEVNCGELLKNNIILPDKDVYVPHEIRTYHEDIGFNRCLGVMVATGRMRKA